MNSPRELTDQQLLNLYLTEGHLDSDLQMLLWKEIQVRNLEIPEEFPKNQESELSRGEKILYFLLPMIISAILAAHYRGLGEMRKYKQAWRMILFGTTMYLLAFCLYFAFHSET